ncbi:MAG: rod shape determining protein RodA [Burkholderiaceae bacterium]
MNLGIVIQPSEIMKIAMPLMLAWFFQKREGMVRWTEFLVATILLAIPVALIARQPDLGTALLVLAAGFYVIFLAGLSWKVIAGLFVTVAASLPVLWTLLHDYQRQRVMMLIDPTSDPLGKGFHIIQSTIAVGSGGLFGKGWLKGTQAHLEFIPERTTDFIFAVYSEEFGLVGNLVLLTLYMLLIGRGLVIAANAPTVFTRLLAGAITMIFFTYAFVNMGMVSGILPVVGVPLPLMSYGGTALVTLGLGAGILMSIQRHRTLVQS